MNTFLDRFSAFLFSRAGLEWNVEEAAADTGGDFRGSLNILLLKK